MFTLSERRRVEWPVKVHVADKGATRVEKFTAVFEVPDVDEAIEAIGDGRDVSRVRDFLAAVWVGWREVVDPDGREIPFSDEAKAQALRRHDVIEAVGEAFQEVLRGGRRKN